jgi:pyrroloquinoline quinone biosynthesis protein B
MNTIRLIGLFLFIGLLSCNDKDDKPSLVAKESDSPIYLKILGVAQDAGFPQINCYKSCCRNLWNDKSLRKMVSCIGVADEENEACYLFDATPDVRDQLEVLQKNQTLNLDGIFLTHAHMGHYTGLMHLGREAMGAENVPVFAMPKMQKMLEENAPWSQLVSLENIKIQPLQHDSIIQIPNLKITPFQVPHRDEFSETVGFKIQGKNKSALFIPDIDKWGKWNRNILDEIRKVDYAFLDGTFLRNGEIFGRDMSLIPHPFIEESIQLFNHLSAEEKDKIYFIHFNHTNPVLQQKNDAVQQIEKVGMHIAEEGQVFPL